MNDLLCVEIRCPETAEYDQIAQDSMKVVPNDELLDMVLLSIDDILDLVVHKSRIRKMVRLAPGTKEILAQKRAQIIANRKHSYPYNP